MNPIKVFILFSLFVLVESCDTAFERDLAGKKVTLLSPVDNIITTDTLQTFYWERLDGATEYQLQVVSPRFDSIARLIADTIMGRNSFPIDLDPQRYEWRVRAFNSGSSSEPGDIRNFEIQ